MLNILSMIERNILILFLTGLLISVNWFTWLYAVKTNNLLDGALGYYIFPILSILSEIQSLSSEISIHCLLLSEQ